MQSMRAEIQVLRTEMRAEMQGLRSEIQALRAEFHTHYRWLVGIMLVQTTTVLAAVLGALLTR